MRQPKQFARTARHAHQAQQQLDQRALARAVGPQQPDHPRLDAQRKVVQRPQAAVVFRDAVEGEEHYVTDNHVSGPKAQPFAQPRAAPWGTGRSAAQPAQRAKGADPFLWGCVSTGPWTG